MATRDDPIEIARRAADALERGRAVRAFIGFDGFIDTFFDAVDARTDLGPHGYTRIPTISAFSARLGAAAGKSTNVEFVERGERFGGNGPLMASAMAALGARVTYVGAVGAEEEPRRLNPVYAPLARVCEEVVPICAAGRTDCLEFDDGKLMFNKCGAVQGVTWDAVKDAVGIERLVETASSCDVIGIVNWVMLGGVEEIWSRLTDEVMCRLPAKRPMVFIDLCDPAKRSDGDIARAMHELLDLNCAAPVTLGLNLAEAERLASVVGLGAISQDGANLADDAARLRERLALTCVVVHPRHGAAGADGRKRVWVDGPFTDSPRISTGAGDHFNGGFATGRALGLPIGESLAAGCATSGAYVRDGSTPGRTRVCELLRGTPP